MDWLKATTEDRRELAGQANSSTKLLAEKIEAPAELDEAIELGYDFFQGYFLSKPAMISGKRVVTFKPHLLELLQAVTRPDFDFKEIEESIKQDVALSYRMLRFANSAASGLAQKVTSLGHALVMLGQQEVARAASLLVLADLGGDKPQELAVNSLARASFMESLATYTSVSVEAVDVFLTGLCSRLDAMLDLPMTDVVSRLPLSGPVSGALLGGDGVLRMMLDLAIAYDAAQWDRVSVLANTLGVPDLELAACYLKATEYSDRVFGNITPDNS